MTKKCITCNELIPEGRVKALPSTRTCTECSTTTAGYVRNVVAGKTDYMETEIIKDAKLGAVLREMDKKVGWGSNLDKG